MTESAARDPGPSIRSTRRSRILDHLVRSSETGIAQNGEAVSSLEMPVRSCSRLADWVGPGLDSSNVPLTAYYEASQAGVRFWESEFSQVAVTNHQLHLIGWLQPLPGQRRPCKVLPAEGCL